MSRLNTIGSVSQQHAPRVELDEIEQANAIVASVEAHMDIVQLGEEADRFEDLATGLENLAAVSTGIESATAIELGLIDVASDLAMAGSIHTGEVVTPGLESAEGQTVSVEGIKSIAQDIWKAIKEFVKKIWKRVDDFFHKIFGALPRLRKQLIALRERADGYIDKSIEESKTDVGSAGNPLVVNNVAPKSAKDIQDALETVKAVVDGLFDTYTRCVIDRGDVIKAGLKEYKPGKDWTVEQHASALAKVHAFDNDWGKIKKAFDASEVKTKDRRFSENVKVYGTALPGNMSIFVQEPEKEAGAGTLGVAEGFRGRTVRIMSTFERSQDAIEELEIDTLAVADIKSIVDFCIDIVDGVEAWERGKNIKTIKGLVNDIEKGGDTLKKAESSLEDTSSEIRAYPKSAMNFVKSFTTWSAEPHTSITNNGLAAVRAAITVCNKSLSNYK